MKLSRVLVMGTFLSALLASGSRAADPTPEDIDKAEKRGDAVATLALAGELAAFGREVKSPESLVLAGGMLLRANGAFGGKAEALAEKPTDGKGNPVAGDAGKAVPFDKQAEALFDEARALAAESKDKGKAAAVEALIKDAKAFPTRGSVGGPHTASRTLNAGETHTYNFTFFIGQQAAVSMTSSGPAKIQFDIIQPNGTNLFSLKGHNANYNWVPQKGGKDDRRTFTITLTNLGNKPTTYSLTKN